MRLAVVGAGAIGGTVGAYLVRGGHDVTFVDLDAAHVSAIRDEGLRIEGPIDAFEVRAPAYLPQEVPDVFETVLVCVKAHATESAAQALRPFLSPYGHVVSLQNGLNELVLASVVGPERTIGSFVNFGADYVAPGVIHFGGRGTVVVGELDGTVTPRLDSVVRLLRDFEPTARATDNIWGFLWAKLAVGAMIFATALTDEPIAECYATPRHRALFTAIAREVLTVARSHGVRPEPFDGFGPADFLPGADPARTERSLDAMVAFNRRSAKTHSGVWRDLAVRKRKTEGEAHLGAIVERAAATATPAPLATAILDQIRAMEAGVRPRTPANLDELDALRRLEATA